MQLDVVNVIFIQKEIPSVGNSPILATCDDNEEYYVKNAHIKETFRYELINEIISNRILKLWGLEVPDMKLINVSEEQIKLFKSNNGGELINDLNNFKSLDKLRFGSKNIRNGKQYNEYNSEIDLRKFRSPIDLLKIGVFDFWLSNQDRTQKNPNDNVSGYTIKQIEDGLRGRSSWSGWRDGIKEKNNNPTEGNVDLLFSNWF